MFKKRLILLVAFMLALFAGNVNAAYLPGIPSMKEPKDNLLTYEFTGSVTAGVYTVGYAFPIAALDFELGATFSGVLYACDNPLGEGDADLSDDGECVALATLTADTSNASMKAQKKWYVIDINTAGTATMTIKGTFDQVAAGGAADEVLYDDLPSDATVGDQRTVTDCATTPACTAGGSPGNYAVKFWNGSAWESIAVAGAGDNLGSGGTPGGNITMGTLDITFSTGDVTFSGAGTVDGVDVSDLGEIPAVFIADDSAGGYDDDDITDAFTRCTTAAPAGGCIIELKDENYIIATAHFDVPDEVIWIRGPGPYTGAKVTGLADPEDPDSTTPDLVADPIFSFQPLAAGRVIKVSGFEIDGNKQAFDAGALVWSEDGVTPGVYTGETRHRGLEFRTYASLTATRFFRSVIVEDMYIHSVAGEAVYIAESDFSIVRNNKIRWVGCYDGTADGGGIPAQWDQGTLDTSVTDNEMLCGDWGNANTAPDNQEGRQTKGVGIEIGDYSDTFYIYGNDVQYATKMNIQTQAGGNEGDSRWPTDGFIYNNRVGYGHDAGIALVQAQNVSVSNNHIFTIDTPWADSGDNVGKGITCRDGNRQTKITDNLIEGTHGIGIRAGCGCGTQNGSNTDTLCQASTVANTVIRACQDYTSEAAITTDPVGAGGGSLGDFITVADNTILDSANCASDPGGVAGTDYTTINLSRGDQTFYVADYTDLPTAYAACKTAGGGNVVLPRGRTTIAITGSDVSPYLDATGVDNGAGSFKGVCAITGYGAGDYQNNSALQTNGGSELFFTNIDDMVSDNVTAINDGAGITDSDTSVTVDDTTGFPSANSTIRIGSEIIFYQGTTGTTFTGLQRGYEGTTQAAHADDAEVSGEEIAIAVGGEGTLLRDFSLVHSGSHTDSMTKLIQVRSGSGSVIQNVVIRNNSSDTGTAIEMIESEKSSITDVRVSDHYVGLRFSNGITQSNNATVVSGSTFRSGVIGVYIDGDPSGANAETSCAANLEFVGGVIEGNSLSGLGFDDNAECTVNLHGTFFENSGININVGTSNDTAVMMYGGHLQNDAATADYLRAGDKTDSLGPDMFYSVHTYNPWDVVTAGDVLVINPAFDTTAPDEFYDSSNDAAEIIYLENIDSDHLDLTDTYAWTGAHDFGGATVEIPNSTTLPATCNVGESYMDTDATTGQRFYLCESANTWALQGDGGAGGGDDVQVQALTFGDGSTTVVHTYDTNSTDPTATVNNAGAMDYSAAFTAQSLTSDGAVAGTGFDAVGANDTATIGDLSFSNESLLLDFDTATDNQVGISSSSGVVEIDFAAIDLTTTGDVSAAIGTFTGAVSAASFTADPSATPTQSFNDTVADDTGDEARIVADANADDNGSIELDVEAGVDNTYETLLEASSTGGSTTVAISADAISLTGPATASSTFAATGAITGTIDSTYDTATNIGTLTDADTKGHYYGVTATGTITLPAITASGLHACFQAIGASITITIDPNAADGIRLDGTLGTDGVTVVSPAASGDMICFNSRDNGTDDEWIQMGKIGTWTVGS